MTVPKSLRIGFVLFLVAALAGLFLFVRMYREDVQALEAFIASYDRFDRAMPSDAGPAAEALAELEARASLRLSSLIRHDGELMAQARAIAVLAKREYQSLASPPGGGPAAQGQERKAAFARFLELSPRAGSTFLNRRSPHGS